MGYAIGCRHDRHRRALHASVRIEREVFREWKQRLEALALRCSTEDFSAQLHAMPFEPYAPIRDQFGIIWRAIN